MREIQVLDSFGPDVLARDDLTLILQGLKKHLDIASESTNFSIGEKWQNLDVTSWPIKEYSYERVQEDGTSCGLFLTNYMEYWTGDELSDNVTQEDMTQFRRKLAVILHDSELNRLKGNPEFPEVVHTIDASKDTNEHSPTKHNMESGSSNDLIKDKSPPCILPSRTLSENSGDLVGELCTFIMSIDDVKSLEKEWVVSSKPYPISITLKKIQDILKSDQAMDRKSFNMAVCILACDELLMLKDTPDHFMDLQFCSMVSEYARDPKLRTKPDIQSLAKLLGSWPGTDYNISSCRLIVLPYATLDHFILFVINQHAKSVSILDSLGISVASAELKMIQDLRYALKLQRIAFYLNQALEVAHPEWNDDIFYWHRRLPACVPKSTDRNLSGYYAFSSMLLWNGNDLNLPICKDGDQLRKQFLMHLLSYIDNETAHNIKAVARELISRTRKY